MTTLKYGRHDVIFLQETHINDEEKAKRCRSEWEGTSFWGLGNHHSCGVAILFDKKLDLKINNSYCHPNGRLIKIDCTIDSQRYTLINVYAHNEIKPRNLFFEEISVLLQNCGGLLVLGGDFNCVEDPTLDKTKMSKRTRVDSFDKIKQIISSNDLIDTYRHLHPLGVATTYYCASARVSTRIDRVYVPSEEKTNIVEVSFLNVLGCDHRGVKLKLKTPVPPQGKGYWKCNVSVLKDPHFEDDFAALWLSLVAKAELHYSLEWWDLCKKAFKNLIICHSSRLAGNRRAEFSRLSSLLNKYKKEEHADPLYYQPLIGGVEAELATLLDSTYEGAKIRSKALHLDSTDKAVSFFLRTEAIKGKNKTIHCLKSDGKTLTSSGDIAQECTTYYKSLLSKQPVDKASWAQLAENLPSLPPEDSQSCEGEITFVECWQAIRAMADHKSPGCDGLPAEFYKRYFKVFGDIFTSIVNNNDGFMSQTQRVGLITLLCKDPDHADELGNWRPISLLNIDYKIIAKVLVNRLKNVAPSIVGPEQSCGIVKRSVFDNMHFLRNVFDYCKERKFPCIALCFDQAKAFDSVDHGYLFFILEALGFGPSFIKWVRFLYNDIYSAVIVNGVIGDLFEVTRSMRQGCGLSPLLYVLCIEPLAHIIRSSLIFKGIPMPAQSCPEARIILHADDTTVLAHDVASINTAIDAFTLYGKASGASLNYKKSMACIITGRPDKTNWPAWLPCNPVVKICGIYYGENSKNLIEDDLKTKLIKQLSILKTRNLTLLGKVTLLNVTLLSKLWYVATCHILSPELHIWLERLIFNFIWGSTSEKMRRLTLIRPYNEGGLGAVHIKSRCAALYIKHLTHLIERPETLWAPLARYWVALPLRKHDNEVWNNLAPHAPQPNYFYKEAYKHYTLFVNLNPTPVPVKAIVKKAYTTLVLASSVPPRVFNNHHPEERKALWNRLQKIPISPEARNFIWLVSHEILPVKCFLLHRRIVTSDLCPMCQQQPETIEHCLLDCSAAAPIKLTIYKYFPSLASSPSSSLLALDFPNETVEDANMMATVLSEGLFMTWLARNDQVFRGKTITQQAQVRLFLHRIRVRIRVDHHRLGPEAFAALWLNKPLPVIRSNNKLSFKF
jgi:exonuclease III